MRSPRAPAKPRPILILFLIGVALVGAGFVAAPFLAFRSLRAAAKFNDLQALAEVVDYPAVRQSLSAQLRGGGAAQAPPPPDILHDPIGALRRALQPAPATMDVDVYLTPSALAALTAGREQGTPAPKGGDGMILPRVRYWGPERCRLAVPEPGRVGRETLFTFQRRGMFTWKLVGIGLPGSVPAG